jgi:hypothetical protein
VFLVNEAYAFMAHKNSLQGSRVLTRDQWRVVSES